MTKGTMCIIGCPVLEDEIRYSVMNDKEEKKVYLVNTGPSHTLKRKLEMHNIPFTEVGEWEFEKGYVEMDKEKFNIVIVMNKLGLHARPEFLRSFLEEQLGLYNGHVDVIALYYGMCGNAGWDVSQWASEKLNVPVFVFRDDKEEVCDDCIGVAVGGHSRYYEFVKKYPGMFYVTPAIAENWGEYTGELDFTKGWEVMNIFTVKEVFQAYGYKNAVKIDTGLGIGGETLEKGCARFSEETGLKFVMPEPGFLSMYPTERIYRDAKAALKK